MPSPQVILKSEPVHPFGLAVYGEHIFWTDWVRRAVQRANKYVGSDMKLLRVDIPQQPMGIIAVANDTNSCECGCCHQPCCPAPHADMYIHTQVHTHTHTHMHSHHPAAGPRPTLGHPSICCDHSSTQNHMHPWKPVTHLHASSAWTPPSSVCTCTDTLPHWAWLTKCLQHRSTAFLGLMNAPEHAPLHT